MSALFQCCVLLPTKLMVPREILNIHTTNNCFPLDSLISKSFQYCTVYNVHNRQLIHAHCIFYCTHVHHIYVGMIIGMIMLDCAHQINQVIKVNPEPIWVPGINGTQHKTFDSIKVLFVCVFYVKRNAKIATEWNGAREWRLFAWLMQTMKITYLFPNCLLSFVWKCHDVVCYACVIEAIANMRRARPNCCFVRRQ